MARKSKRRRIRERRRSERRRSYLIWGGIAAVVLAVIGYFVWVNVRPQAGESVQVMPSRDHVQEGTDPGPFNTNPPSSGEHYARTLPAGFYTEQQAEQIGEYPEGYIVHSLEHGYVVFWYNCEATGVTDCGALQNQIREVMNDFDNFKVIAFPWTSIEVPVAMTSWGHMLKMEQFDASAAADFIDRNRFQAPEPNAP
ncbi:MAG: DUF3105 domain-containing protein [Anaerolineales bacterium]|nr:DUF3105 domain-containing protein [Anaerolineales bacterium]